MIVNRYDTYGPAMRELQKQFPIAYNNGKTVPKPDAQSPDELEPTVIVRVH